MRARVHEVRRQGADVSAARLDRLEHDLHVACIEQAGNPEMVEALARTRCVLISSKHIAGNNGASPAADPFLAEHDAVLAAVQAGDAARAADAMAAHLDLSVEKASRRLAAFRSTERLPTLPFIGVRKEYAAAVARGTAAGWSSASASEPGHAATSDPGR
jgi:DNA-binding GntR family transcriptional regulator